MLTFLKLMFYKKLAGHTPFYSFLQLEPIHGFVHAVTARHREPQAIKSEDARFPLQVADSNDVLLAELGLSGSDLKLLRQIHSTRIVDSSNCPAASSPPEADGIVLMEAGHFGVIRTADCVPIILVAPEEGICCLLHAGWRGTLDHLARLGVQALQSRAGTRPDSIVAALGPCIEVCCYEVGPDFPENFAANGHDPKRIFRGKNLDLIAANRADLREAGVQNILTAGTCTACNHDRFYSYRALADTGRIWTLAGFRT